MQATAAANVQYEQAPCRAQETASTMVESLAKMKHASDTAMSSSPTTHQQPSHQHQEETIFSTIGLGILPDFCRRAYQQDSDPNNNNNNNAAGADGCEEDATEAACKAIQDAMERGVLAFTSSQQHQPHSQQQQQQQQQRPQLSIRIGVPTKLGRPQELMQVNQFKVMAQLNSLQQRGVELQQIETVAGGLWAQQQHQHPDCRGILSVVACLSVVKSRRAPTLPAAPVAATQAAAAATEASFSHRNAASPTSVTTTTTATTAAVPLTRMSPKPVENSSSSSNNNHPSHHQHQERMQVDSVDPVITPSSYGEAAATAAATQRQPPFRDFHRSSSMDVLARVSAEIRDMQPAAVQQQPPSQVPAEAANAAAASEAVYGDKYGNNTNYKKLPPGKTPKNNKRLFVKHSYRDFSVELPSSDEKALMQERTPNAAFPLKLHETLSEIERDGYDDIIGWLAHGRSFKIHKQQEFVEQILPKYFVMTKKSSFLRQLNLYGFNRLSGVGPDQGSYYHEAFLRGMKFLCRRMQRIKVNGNRIRAAGNPDEEPVLSNYPSCPRNDAQAAAAAAVSEASNSHNLATAAVLQQLMASQRSPPAPAPRPGISPLFGLVPSPATTNALLAGAPTAAEVATLLASRNASLSSSLGLQTSLSNPALLENHVTEVLRPQRKAVRSSSMSSSSSAGTNNNNSNVTTNATPAGNGTIVSFPLKLHRILDKLEAEGHDAVLSWLPHGRAFVVKNSDRLVSELMPLHFNQTKYSSFQRQLHMYNFQRITTGRDKGAYHHPQFLRGQSLLCQKMGRTRVNGKGTRQPGNPQTEPDFYQFAPLPRIPVGVSVEIPQQMVYQATSSSGRSASPAPLASAQRETSASSSTRRSAPSVSSSSGGADSEEER